MITGPITAEGMTRIVDKDGELRLGWIILLLFLAVERYHHPFMV